MARTPAAAETWATSAARTMSDAGYRRGGARAAVLGLLDTQSCALTAYEIEEALRGRDRAVGRASVYRILDELEALHLVTRVDVGQGQARYEPARADHHHHHLVCDVCGTVIPFHDDDLEGAILTLSREVDFDVTEHEIVLHGVCADCR